MDFVETLSFQFDFYREIIAKGPRKAHLYSFIYCSVIKLTQITGFIDILWLRRPAPVLVYALEQMSLNKF